MLANFTNESRKQKRNEILSSHYVVFQSVMEATEPQPHCDEYW